MVEPLDTVLIAPAAESAARGVVRPRRDPPRRDPPRRDPPRRDPPRIGTAVVAVVVFVEVVIGASLLVHGSGPLEQNFLSERGSITLLSSALMLIGSGLAAVTSWTMRRDTLRARLLWAGLAAVLLFFGVDEVMEFHEQLGSYLGAGESAGPFRNWNDIVVLAYGLVAIPTALLFWREVRHYPRLLTMLAISAVLYIATSAVDELVAVPTSLSVIVEEGLKLHCSAFLALSMFTGLRAARWLVATGRAR